MNTRVMFTLHQRQVIISLLEREASEVQKMKEVDHSYLSCLKEIATDILIGEQVDVEAMKKELHELRNRLQTALMEKQLKERRA